MTNFSEKNNAQQVAEMQYYYEIVEPQLIAPQNSDTAQIQRWGISIVGIAFFIIMLAVFLPSDAAVVILTLAIVAPAWLKIFARMSYNYKAFKDATHK